MIGLTAAEVRAPVSAGQAEIVEPEKDGRYRIELFEEIYRSDLPEEVDQHKAVTAHGCGVVGNPGRTVWLTARGEAALAPLVQMRQDALGCTCENHPDADCWVHEP
jgi:hypothetical protein